MSFQTDKLWSCFHNKDRKKIRVLFLCKKLLNSYGISTGLYRSSLYIHKRLQELGFTSSIETCVDANCINKYVTQFKPTHVILGAIWVTPTKLKELMSIHPSVTWNTRIHSKPVFLSNEGQAIAWINEFLQLGNKSHISGNSIDFCNTMKKTYEKDFYYLPNMYHDFDDNSKMSLFNSKKKVLNIGCFGSVRPLKNILIQAMAAIAYGNENKYQIVFHINSGRTEQSGEQTLKNIRNLFSYPFELNHKLVEHGWLEHDEFLALVKKMDLGMQVSLSETFNLVTTDFVKLSKPIVVSEEIEWMPKIFQAKPNDIDDIMCKMDTALFRDCCIFKDISKIALKKHNKTAEKIWIKYLEK